MRRCVQGGVPRRAVRGLLTVIVAGALALSGCSTVVTGIPAAAPDPAPASSDSRDLTALLPGPGDFPVEYSVQVLEYRDAVLASADLRGVSGDAHVNPVRCQPPANPPAEGSLAMVSGMSAVDQNTLAVVLTRADDGVEAAREAVERCLEVVSDQYGVQSQTNRSMLPSPAAGTAGEFAYAQTVSSGSGDVAMSQQSITLVAQVGGVRIAVTGMSQRDVEVDRAALEQVFKAAVAKAR